MNNKPAAAALACALLAAPAHAQELSGTLARVKEAGAITLGYREAAAPFSFLDDKRQPVGYSLEICAAIVEEVKRELALGTLDVKLVAVTPQTRIPMLANGGIDLECGATPNTLTRQRLVAFAPVTFITGTRLLAKKPARVKSYRDLRGKVIAVTQGTASERLVKALSDKDNLAVKFLNAKDHEEALAAVDSGRAAAFAMDDIVLHALVLRAKDPRELEVTGDYLSYEPYAIMFRINDEPFGTVVRRAIARLAGDPGQCNGPLKALYRKWFVDKLPSGESLNLPMGALLEAACRLHALPD